MKEELSDAVERTIPDRVFAQVFPRIRHREEFLLFPTSLSKLLSAIRTPLEDPPRASSFYVYLGQTKLS
jgi:hypothetical protein